MVMMIQILKKKRIKELSEELNEVKQINSDLVKKNEWEYLISSINMFITKTLSTSVRSCEQSIPGKQPIISPIRLNKLLAAYGITLLKPLSPGEWKSFCEEVVCDQNGNLSERIGVHPVVLEVIKATLKRASFESAQNSAAIKSASSSSSSSTLPIAAEPMIPVHYDIQHEVIKVDEEKIAKIPDVTIVTRHCRSKSIGSSVLIIEIKKKSGLIEAINQSLGYLMVKLRDRLEIAEEARSRIFGFCFGTNGYNIILGCIEIQNFKLSVQCTNLDEIPFWISPDKPTVETLGVRLLRSLMSCTESQLGHTFQNAALVGMRGELDLCFQLQSIVGRGGFATVFEASISDKVVAIKKATRTIADKSRQHILQIAHMNREVTMLKLLQYCNTTTNDVATLRVSTMCHSSSTLGDERHQGHFPSLLFNDWICDDSQPYIPLVPLGVPLVLYASGLSKAARKKEAILLRQHLNESLKAANLLGYCHCDLRPDNVIYSQSSTEFIIIDWGLGCEINSACHHYFGGLPFFHDAVIEHYIELVDNEHAILPYEAEFDLASAAYVEVAFVMGQKNLSAPWDISISCLIESRTEYMATFNSEN